METETKIRVGDLVRMGMVFMPGDQLYWGKIIEVYKDGALVEYWEPDWARPRALPSRYQFAEIEVVIPFKERMKTVGFGRVPGGAR